MKITIFYNERGEIIATARPPANPKLHVCSQLHTLTGQFAFEVEASPELERLSPEELHGSYRVEMSGEHPMLQRK